MVSARKSMSARKSGSARRNSPKSVIGMDTNSVLVCVLVVALIAIGLYYLIKENRNIGNNRNVEHFESQPAELNNLSEKPNPKGKDLIIVLFYVDWCPHCVSTKPEWEKLVNNMNNTNIKGHNVKVNACNAEGTQVEKDFANENNVQGYPTIKLIKEDEVVDYNGARNAESMEEFIKENAN